MKPSHITNISTYRYPNPPQNYFFVSDPYPILIRFSRESDSLPPLVAPADKARGEDTDGSAKAKSPLSLDHCGNCGVESDELRKCKQCGAVAYCGEACQKVSRGPRATTTRRLALPRRSMPHSSHHLLPPPSSHLKTPRSIGGAATRQPARPTSSPPPSTRSRSGCARRRWRRTVA